MALHGFDIEEVCEAVKNLEGRGFDIYITPQTRKPPRTPTRRTSFESSLRQFSFILDVDAPERGSSCLPREEVRKLLEEVLSRLPPRIRRAARLLGYTGGGCQVVLLLDPPLEGCGEIKFFHKALQELLGGLPYIDPASLKPGQLQRLLGTKNFKRGGVQTDILEEREAEPLDPHHRGEKREVHPCPLPLPPAGR
ncbi:MAG: hypothetical protein Q9N26_02615 [Aquificota bacterium]|nr:hypothetical protein [Aquificota bacterium]